MDPIVFRTLGPWGAGKGANLIASEVDHNFWALAQAIFELQSDPATPNGIATITVSGTQMTIYLHDGTVLGPYTLPVLTFRWRDEWTPSTAYAGLDVFKVTNVGIFMVQIAHTSGTTFDKDLLIGGQPALLMLFGSADASLSSLPDVQLTGLTDGDFLTWVDADSKWENVTLPGASTTPDGTMMSNVSGSTALPVANTLTQYLDHVLGTSTRGTVLFRGSSIWTGLAPGTSGQFLQTGGTAADPSWVTSSGSVTAPKYNIGCYVPAILTTNQNLLFHKFSKAVTVPANFGAYLGHSSVAGAAVAATASTTITVDRALSASPTTFSNVGNIAFAAAAASATFTSSGGAAISFAQGDVLRVRAPATADATLADFFATLVGYET